ncbi:MAG TPA: OmpA family protein [Bacteroidia bacterium]|nr:OmpA family protein [Bacteroidia bacterium]
MRTSLLLFLLFFFMNGPAQNLIINPGFETNGVNKTNGGDCFQLNGVPGWFNPSDGSTDYFTSNPKDPMNAFGMNFFGGPCTPHSGKCFSGFIPYLSDREYREYEAGELSAPLEAGKYYEISFSIMLGPLSEFKIDQLDVFFMNEKGAHVPNSGPYPCGEFYHIDSLLGKTQLGKWLDVKLDIVAQGGEKFFVLGNLSNDKHTKAEQITSTVSPNHNYAYYYFDDASVVPLNAKPKNVREMTVVLDSTLFEPGKKLVLSTINFDLNKATLRPESYKILDQVVQQMKNKPWLKVEIDGHTDLTGKQDANQKLSEARAKSVADYLISKGIPEYRITTKGYGSSRPVGADDAKNRRVEFIFHE